MRPSPTDDIYFFVRVMKTGTTSFVSYLREIFGPDAVHPDGDRKVAIFMVDHLRELSAERRAAFRAYQGHYPACAAEIVGATKTMTLLRDPVERTISLLKQNQRLLDQHKHLDLAQIYEDELWFKCLIENHQTKMFALELRDDPQSVMDVVEMDHSRFELAKRQLASIDVVGVQEDHDAFVSEAQAAFGWPAPTTRWHELRGHDAPVPDALRERIAADNAWDIRLYEWALENVVVKSAASAA